MDVQKIRKGIFHPKLTGEFLLQQAGAAISHMGDPILRRNFDDNGIRILDRDWDTLIILDCGRYDIFSEIVDLSGSLTKERSIASETGTFIKRNFENRRAHDVVYLSANPVVGNRKEYLDIHKLIGMWHSNERQKRGQENRRGLMDPTRVVEKSIDLHKQYPNKRHIVHLLPPHVPHIFKDGDELEPHSPYQNYDAAREGKINASVMRDVYAENYQYVLKELQPLLEGVDGKTVVTADHGELLGEGVPRWVKLFHDRWGNKWNKYNFGHYKDVDVPELVDIPWFELPVETRREIIPESPGTDEYDTDDIEDQLEALGYK